MKYCDCLFLKINAIISLYPFNLYLCGQLIPTNANNNKYFISSTCFEYSKSGVVVINDT